VDLRAVDLDREAAVGPREVHVVPSPRCVLDGVLEHRARQPGVDAQQQESPLAAALGQRCVEPLRAQAAPEVADAAGPIDARQDVGDPLDVEELQELRLLDRPLELVELEHGAEVDQRPVHGGARNAVDDHTILWGVHLRPVESDPVPVPLPAARHHDVHQGGAGCPKPEMRCRRRMRERRAVAPGEHRGHEVPAARQVPVTHGVNRLVKTMEPSGLDPLLDLVARCPELEHLRVGHHSPLLCRQLSNASRDD
jgi:hypothetical protein